MAYRDTLTVTKDKDGDGFTAKLHGYPFFYHGKTIQECLTNAGRALDVCRNIYDDFKAKEGGDNADQG